MRGEPCSSAWRLSALLLGASWVVTLVVACGGGGDDGVATPVAVGVPGSASRGEAGLAAGATGQVLQAQARDANAAPTTSVQPCAEVSRQAAPSATLPAQRRATVASVHELSDEALNLPAGGPAAPSAQIADPFEATK